MESGIAFAPDSARLHPGYRLDPKIELIFLPPYASNLNLIEDNWRFFKIKSL